MANRLTDSEKWDDPWFESLSNNDKLFWMYLCDNCNHAGIWKVSWKKVKYHLGDDFKFNDIPFSKRIQILDEEKWFLKGFVLFQQKINNLTQLNPLNKVHQSIINILEKEAIISPFVAPKEGLERGYSKGNSKGKDKSNTIDRDNKNRGNNIDNISPVDWFDMIKEFRVIGMNEVKIKENLMNVQGLSESEADLAMGKKF